MTAYLPTLLDFPAPKLRVYSRETVIAEKLEALRRQQVVGGAVQGVVALADL